MPTVTVVSKMLALAVGLTLLLAAPATAQQRQVERTREARSDAQQLTQYFADKLMLADRAEEQLARIAEQRARSPQVKRLAQTLIQDHTKLDERLAELVPQAADRFVAQDGRRAAERRPPQTRTSVRESSGEHAVLTELCMINHRTADNEIARSTKMLQQYQGQDFDMAFLGMQIAGHTWLLSELQAIENVGTSDFQKLVAEATSTVEHHLEKAQALSNELEQNQRKTSS